ncbi:DUF58 domain-containing protein [Motiliproteus coralliicola]|uniref:DUF58 domain-containing protein n=2 Tax=Motiliproteus coralliicola TaxID=2283196 RepID=A0A369WUW9_9GAMM|nr:DUF58 domain-containing protein [Motiliproteus coralliicola]
MTLALFIGGINYGNGLILLVALFLVSLFMSSILLTYANLAGLRLSRGSNQPGFVGQQVAFGLLLESEREHESIAIGAPGVAGVKLDLIEQRRQQQPLLLDAKQRGRLQLPRLKIESRYPLGLLRAWSWLELDSRALVYPKPIAEPYPQRLESGSGRGQRLSHEGSDDFDGLRPYQGGDNPRQIAWKNYARDGRLHSKRFAGYQQQARWLEWEAYSGMGVEARLSRLCHWVIQYHQQGLRFGLRLPGAEVAPGQGDLHLQRCLSLLALYGLSPEPATALAEDSVADLSAVAAEGRG